MGAHQAPLARQACALHFGSWMLGDTAYNSISQVVLIGTACFTPKYISPHIFRGAESVREKRTHLTAGTRGSALALAQARWVEAQIRAANPGVEVREKIIKTGGDRVQDVPLAQIGQKGVFVKELEAALDAGEIDIAIHSLKDLPSTLSPSFCLAAIPQREDPRDCLISPRHGTLEKLPEGAIVGTGSPRRAAQLLLLRSDISVREIRGNVDTRIKKATTGEYDAIVLAVAGLKRLGLNDNITQVFEPSVMIPAVGQGALAIEARTDDDWAIKMVSRINDHAAGTAVLAERSLAEALGASCTVPVGALAVIDGNTIHLRAMLSDSVGTLICEQVDGPLSDPSGLGRNLATIMMARGAKRILELYK